jgi:hypothetical protein
MTPERWPREGQPLRTSERPFRDAGSFRTVAAAPPGALIRCGQKPRRGARGETHGGPEATLGPSMPAGEQAGTWVTWNHFSFLPLPPRRSVARPHAPALGSPEAVPLAPRPEAHKVVTAILTAPGVRPQPQQHPLKSRSVVILEPPAAQIHAPAARAARVPHILHPPGPRREPQPAIPAPQRPYSNPAPQPLAAVPNSGIAKIPASAGGAVQHGLVALMERSIVAPPGAEG